MNGTYIIHPSDVRPWQAKIPVGAIIRFRCIRLEDGGYRLDFEELEECALEAKP